MARTVMAESASLRSFAFAQDDGSLLGTTMTTFKAPGDASRGKVGGSRGLQAPESPPSCAGALAPVRYPSAMPLAPQEVRTFFVTFVIAQRRRLFQVEEHFELFLSVMGDQRTKGRMQIHAYVVMPNHVHMLLTPAPDVSLEKAIQYLKGGFSFRLKSKSDVWERSFNEERVRDGAAFDRIREYIESNPVRARMVSSPADSPWSSAFQPSLADERPQWLDPGLKPLR